MAEEKFDKPAQQITTLNSWKKRIKTHKKKKKKKKKEKKKKKQQLAKKKEK